MLGLYLSETATRPILEFIYHRSIASSSNRATNTDIISALNLSYRSNIDHAGSRRKGSREIPAATGAARPRFRRRPGRARRHAGGGALRTPPGPRLCHRRDNARRQPDILLLDGNLRGRGRPARAGPPSSAAWSSWPGRSSSACPSPTRSPSAAAQGSRRGAATLTHLWGSGIAHHHPVRTRQRRLLRRRVGSLFLRRCVGPLSLFLAAA